MSLRRLCLILSIKSLSFLGFCNYYSDVLSPFDIVYRISYSPQIAYSLEHRKFYKIRILQNIICQMSFLFKANLLRVLVARINIRLMVMCNVICELFHPCYLCGESFLHCMVLSSTVLTVYLWKCSRVSMCIRSAKNIGWAELKVDLTYNNVQ